MSDSVQISTSNTRVQKNRFRLLLPFFSRSKRNMTIGVCSLLHISLSEPHEFKEIRIEVDNAIREEALTPLWPKQGKHKAFVAVFHLNYRIDELLNLTIHNKIRARIGHQDNEGYVSRPITYSVFLRRYCAAHSPMLRDRTNGITAFYRQTVGRSIILTVRHDNVTDRASAKLKLRLAWLVSKLPVSKRPILLYEKDGRHYEESARVVFEALIDQGHDDVFFVAPRNLFEVAPKYLDHFIEPHTFKHYLAFFRCRTFLGTEAMSHCLELRCQSYLVQHKLKDSKNSYVFLQHGVMYMISLDSPQRTSFRRKAMPPQTKIVVSSHMEARHFTEFADFANEDLIVCGLPKFDRSYAYPDADKILIMPTWRPWEFNAARSNPESTAYFQMIQRIVDAIPQELSDKIIVAPHPLFNMATFGSNSSDPIGSYDELLRSVRVLITDYSSISYDAFYRGSNVIFYWEELEDCLEQYGEPTHLMLTEDLAFGPVCHTPSELRDAMPAAYARPQSEDHKQKYRHLVEFHDGRNTERLLKELKFN